MSGFSIAWLDLREPADLAARDRALAQHAIDWLQSSVLSAKHNKNNSPVIVDLGSGTGATLRAMATIVNDIDISDGAEGADLFLAKNAGERVSGGVWRWRLVDKDQGLLREASRRHGDAYLVESVQADLTLVEGLPLADAHLVSASALFDLASRGFVDALVARLKQHQVGLYAALNYNGTTAWEPEHSFDGAVLEAFNRDQRRNKGLGPALGPEATGYLRQTLEAAGFRVWEAPSPWQLQAQHAALAGELITGITAAVVEGYGLGAEKLAAWREFRLASLGGGNCTVGHTDLLALPEV